MLARLKCYLTGHHDPVRHPLGGFRCRRCGDPGVDLGYITPLRRVFSRDRGEVSRTAAWEPSRRGW